MKEKKEFQKALKIVRDTIKKDKDLYYGYQSNIAMPFVDACHKAGIKFPELNEIANNASVSFLNLWLK